MKQTPDGKYLYNITNSAEMVTRNSAKNSAKKVTENTIQKWATLTNADGTTWKGCFIKALAQANVRKTPPKTPPKSAKVTPIDSARKKVNTCIH